MYKNDQQFLEELYESIYHENSVKGLPKFLYELTEAYPELEKDAQIIKDFIIQSGCKSIEIEPMRFGLGAALSNKVIINPVVLKQTKEKALYGIFHEIAHQYQYKKYGNRIEQMFIDQDEEEKGAKFLKMIENVADQFSIRKCRELAKLGVLDPNNLVKIGSYSKYTEIDFLRYLRQFRKVCSDNNITKPEEVNALFYQYITGKIMQQEE